MGFQDHMIYIILTSVDNSKKCPKWLEVYLSFKNNYKGMWEEEALWMIFMDLKNFSIMNIYFLKNKTIKNQMLYFIT